MRDTTFHFITDGIESALTRARAAAGDHDVAIAGGAATINQRQAQSTQPSDRIVRKS